MNERRISQWRVQSARSEDALGDLQALLLHARQRGAGHVFGAARPGEAALLQDKVVVCR